MTKNKRLRILCYNKIHEFNNKKQALDFFSDCFRSCDPSSSEAGRYMYIIQQILNNEQNITDERY